MDRTLAGNYKLSTKAPAGLLSISKIVNHFYKSFLSGPADFQSRYTRNPSGWRTKQLGQNLKLSVHWRCRLSVFAGLEDKEATRSLGINVDKYFSFVFILGSCLAALGGALYVPITSLHPYMGFQVLLLSFAVVIVGGMGNMRGTFVAAFVLGLVMAVTGRFWGAASETMVFIVMAIVLIIKPIEV